MSQNEPQKLYEQHKRLNPDSSLTYEAFLENREMNKQIKSDKLKILSAKEMKDMHKCNKCNKFLRTSKFSVLQNGYRTPSCRKCRNIAVKKLKASKKKEKE